MSAYVVEDKTINKIVAFLAMNQDIKYALRNEGIELNGQESQEKLGQELFEMNWEAVNQRYEEDPAWCRLKDYKYSFELPGSDIQSYKSLRCLIYQCSEGNIDETDLYKKMDRILNTLAHQIVGNLKAFQTAAWE